MRRMSDAEIARTSPPELANLPETIWDDALLVVPVGKKAISLRIDEDVLAWFKAAGPLYQSRMNAVLRRYVMHMRTRRRTAKRPAARPQASGKTSRSQTPRRSRGRAPK